MTFRFNAWQRPAYRRHRVGSVLNRRGIAITESAVVLPVVLLALFSLMDLALLVVRQNALSAAAVQVGRRIALSSTTEVPVNLQEPATLRGTLAQVLRADTTDELVLPMIRPQEIQIEIQWPDGNLLPGSRAAVRVSLEHRSLLGSLLPWNRSQLVGYSQVSFMNRPQG